MTDTAPATNDVEYVAIQLPSRGLFYDGLMDEEGTVEVRKLTSREESILFNNALGFGQRMNNVIRNCCRLPEGLKHDDLLATDRFAILLAIRSFTLGTTDYHISFKCQECGQTNRKFPVNLGADLDEKLPDNDALEPFPVPLKDTDKTVLCRFLRVKDEETIRRNLKQRGAQGQVEDGGRFFRLGLHIQSVNEVPVNAGDAEEFVRSLSYADRLRFEQAIEKMEPGIDLTIYPTCRYCGADNEMALPLDSEFFRPALV